jgi:hypothetical protein
MYTMNIGYGSISVYDSVRHDLLFDTNTNACYFEAYGIKYNVKLNAEHIKNITQNKQIWVILTQQPPSKINNDFKFKASDMTFIFI